MASPLTQLGVDRARFPLAHCAPCGKRTLVYTDCADDGRMLRRCLACDSILPEGEAVIERGRERDVEALGYAFVHRDKEALAAHGLAGCSSTGVRGCGSGDGCGSDGCGG